MSEESKKTIPSMRTFAKDLDAERAKRTSGSSPVEKPKVAEEKKEIPKVAVTKPEPVKVAELKTVVETKISVPEFKTPIIIEKPKVAEVKPPIKIPAFHELQKKVDLIDMDESEFPILSKKPSTPKLQPLKTNIGFDATVITDTKTKRFKLFPSIVESFKTWLKSIKPKKKQLPATQYTVPETSHRKGVIQKATSKTGAAFSADNATLKEQIRLRQQKEPVAKVEKIEPEDKPETIWSPYTEVGYNLLAAKNDATQNVVLEYKKNVPVIPIKNEVVEKTVEKENVVSEPEKETVIENSNLHDNRWNAKNEDIIDKETIPTKIVTPAIIPVAATKKEIAPLEKPVDEEKSVTDLLDFKTNALTISVLLIILTLLVTIFVGKIIIDNINSEADVVVSTTVDPLFSDSELVSIILLSSNLGQINSLLAEAITSAPAGIVELPITSQVGEEITASYAFNLLKFQTKPTLEQAVNLSRFITYNNSQPVLVLKFTDEDAVRGGLLNWETTMLNDFSAIYDYQVTPENRFSDKTVGDLDIRTINNQDSTLIMYGFVNENTVIISPDEALFELFSREF